MTTGPSERASLTRHNHTIQRNASLKAFAIKHKELQVFTRKLFVRFETTRRTTRHTRTTCSTSDDAMHDRVEVVILITNYVQLKANEIAY